MDIRRAAMDLLARREHSRLELQRKLTRRFPEQSGGIETVISRLAREGLQSDRRLAEAFVRARAGKGRGPVRINAELGRKGVGNDVIGVAMEACRIDWQALARRVAAEKISREFGPPVPARELGIERRAKIARFLQQRGFSHEHISAVC